MALQVSVRSPTSQWYNCSSPRQAARVGEKKAGDERAARIHSMPARFAARCGVARTGQQTWYVNKPIEGRLVGARGSGGVGGVLRRPGV